MYSSRTAPIVALLVPVACAATQDRSQDFERVEIDVGANPHVLAAELTGDGRPDLLVDHRSAGGLLPLYGADGAGFEPGEVVVLADFDDDRRDDLAVAPTGEDRVVVLLSRDRPGI